LADAVRGKRFVTVQLPLAPRNRIGIQTGDAGQEGDPPAAVLLRQKAHEQASRTLVGHGNQAVDTAVLLGRRAVGILLATAARAEAHPRLAVLLVHTRFSSWAQDKRPNGFYPIPLKLFLHTALGGFEDAEVIPNARFHDDLRIGSMDDTEIIIALEEEFRLKIPDKDAAKLNTPAEVAQYIEERIGGGRLGGEVIAAAASNGRGDEASPSSLPATRLGGEA
jgi:acyl carrier protein